MRHCAIIGHRSNSGLHSCTRPTGRPLDLHVNEAGITSIGRLPRTFWFALRSTITSKVKAQWFLYCYVIVTQLLRDRYRPIWQTIGTMTYAVSGWGGRAYGRPATSTTTRSCRCSINRFPKRWKNKSYQSCPWVGLGWVGLGWVWLGWVGLGRVEFFQLFLDWVGLGRMLNFQKFSCKFKNL